MTRAIGMWSLALMLAAFTGAAAEEKAAELKVGDKVPAFEVQDDSGQTWKSEDHIGKKIVVVYFYPADCTGGCTRQAIAYNKDLKALEDKGVEVVGVSGDTVDNHKVFKKKESLTFALLADTEGKVAKAFGVPFTAGQKQAKTMLDGEEIVLTREGTSPRWTFVVDKDGKIVHKNTKVNAPEDSKEVMKVVEGLK